MKQLYIRGGANHIPIAKTKKKAATEFIQKKCCRNPDDWRFVKEKGPILNEGPYYCIIGSCIRKPG